VALVAASTQIDPADKTKTKPDTKVSVVDLKGQKVVTGRGYNTQYVLIRALEAAGLRYEDIEPGTEI